MQNMLHRNAKQADAAHKVLLHQFHFVFNANAIVKNLYVEAHVERLIRATNFYFN